MCPMDKKLEKKYWTSRKIAWYAGGFILLVLILYVLFSIGGTAAMRVDREKITVSPVTRGEFQEYITVNGTVMPIKNFYLDATQGGNVIEIYRDEGSYVNVGDSILRLDNTDLHLDIMFREAQLFEQINNLRNTRLALEQNSLRLRGDLLDIDRQIANCRREFEKAERLKAKELISDYDYNRARDDIDYWNKKRDLTFETQRQDSILRAIQVTQLEASVQRMQRNLEVVKQKLEDLVIKAPIAGHLTSLNAEIGESRARGARIGQIDVLDNFKISANVDEYYLSRISAGQAAAVKIDETHYRLTVDKVYLEVRDGRFQVDLSFDNRTPDGIRRGQTVQVKLVLGDLAMATLIPRGGFYQATGGHWLFVLDESGDYATRREIRIGSQNSEYYEVISGLKAGEKCITSTYDHFGDIEKIVFK